MTVCVAAIADGYVIGASDRMLTAGNIQFTPPGQKIFDLTTSIAVMVSGDMNLHAEMLAGLLGWIRSELDAQKAAGQPRWLTVREIAEQYAILFDRARADRAEAKILRPLGLTKTTYVDEQHALSPSLVEKLATELLSFNMPAVSAIFLGVDDAGPHIYVFNNGEVACHDIVAFAAIGMGAYHANSHMMFSRHSKAEPLARALVITYAAKKRAEVAPGVGTETDMLIIGQELGSSRRIEDDIIQELQTVYVNAVERHRAADAQMEKETYEFLVRIAASRAAAQSAEPSVPDGDGSTPTLSQTAGSEPGGTAEGNGGK